MGSTPGSLDLQGSQAHVQAGLDRYQRPMSYAERWVGGPKDLGKKEDGWEVSVFWN